MLLWVDAYDDHICLSLCLFLSPNSSGFPQCVLNLCSSKNLELNFFLFFSFLCSEPVSDPQPRIVVGGGLQERSHHGCRGLEGTTQRLRQQR